MGNWRGHRRLEGTWGTGGDVGDRRGRGGLEGKWGTRGELGVWRGLEGLLSGQKWDCVLTAGAFPERSHLES